MTTFLANHLWQSTIATAVVWLMTLGLRNNGAHVRYGLWWLASLKFAVPFAVLIAAGHLIPARTLPSTITEAAPSLSSAVEPFAPAVDPGVADLERAPVAARSWPAALGLVWGLGALAVAAVRLRGWYQIARTLSASAPQALPVALAIPVRTTETLLEPAVVGILHPVLILPAGIADYLTGPQIEAVLAHELAHVRRRDNLTMAVHMTIETVFWFHPLVWWIGARLIDERERACDEATLARGLRPLDYAAAIVQVCKRYVDPPLACASGVTGANLKRRIQTILSGTATRTMSFRQCALLATTALMAVAVPLTAGLGPGAQVPQPAGAWHFDAVSIRPCRSEDAAPGARSGGGSGSFSPGLVHLDCFLVRNLIQTAYVTPQRSADPTDPINNYPALLTLIGAPGTPQPVRGGPDWVYTAKYTIEAKTNGLDGVSSRGPDRALKLGSMLRALLEDRFQLKTHRATEEASMFALRVAPGGLKIKPIKDGDCLKDRPADGRPVSAAAAAARGVKPTCGTIYVGLHGGNWQFQIAGQDLRPLAGQLSEDLNARVLDQTGITDQFTFVWEYGPDEATPGLAQRLERLQETTSEPATAPNIFVAIKQLGLELTPIKGTRGYLVIDGIERPTPDAPDPRANAPARMAGPGRR